MEIVSTLALLFLFSFFYYMARKDEDYPLEFFSGFAIFLLGALMVGLGFTTYHIADDGTVTNFMLPTTEIHGWIVAFTGIALLMLTWRTSIKLAKVKM